MRCTHMARGGRSTSRVILFRVSVAAVDREQSDLECFEWAALFHLFTEVDAGTIDHRLVGIGGVGVVEKIKARKKP